MRQIVLGVGVSFKWETPTPHPLPKAVTRIDIELCYDIVEVAFVIN